MPQTLPAGMLRTELQMHHDERGWLTEVFRVEWDTGMRPVQWNVVFSRLGTLRGFHVHLKHYDYLVVLKGEMVLGLKDLRIQSPTFGLSTMVTLSEENLEALMIPPGVGHGFYLPVASIHCYAVSEYWNSDDELGCRWNDPGLGLEWPVTKPLVSDQDQNAPTLEELREILQRHEFPEYW